MRNKYLLFDNPQSAFERIFGSLRKARKTIYLETYRIGNDPIGRELLDILLDRDANGVKVTVVVDSLGWGKFSKKYERLLGSSSIDLHIFNPLFQDFSWEKLKRHWNIHFRNHRKLTMVDSKVAYVGGMNYASRELGWEDMMVEITGGILESLISSSREMLGICEKKHFHKRKLYKKLSKSFAGHDVLVRQVPYSRHRLLKGELMKLFSKAQREIVMVTPYLVPDLPFRRALRKAILRGVKVRIVTPRKSDMWMSDIVNHFGCYTSKISGVEVLLHPKMIHSKFVVVDSEVCSFGSANMDYQTFNHNYELNIISENKELVRQLHASFVREAAMCKPYHEKRWLERSWFNRLLTRFLLKHKKHF
jgi:cardiolipin synthase